MDFAFPQWGKQLEIDCIVVHYFLNERVSSNVGWCRLLQLLNGYTFFMSSAQVLGFSTDHLDKDSKEAEGSGVVEAT